MLRWSFLILCSCTAALQGAASGCVSATPLATPVQAFHARSLRLVEALIQLGQDSQVCFGIEALDPDMLRLRADFDVYNTAVGDVVRRILESSPTLEASEQDGVVLVRRKDHGGQTWLDFVVRKFVSPQASLQTINNLLYMTLMTEVDPSIRGFSGHYRTGDSTSHIEPLQQEGKTLRQLLNLLVTSSKGGAMWIACDSGAAKLEVKKGPFWIILEYTEDREDLFSLADGLPPSPRKNE